MTIATMQEQLGIAAGRGRMWGPAAQGLLNAAESYLGEQRPGDAARCLVLLGPLLEAWLLSLGAAPIMRPGFEVVTKEGGKP